MTIPGAVTKRLGDDTLIGACTVLDAETARQCVDAGARFIISPSIDVPAIAQMSIDALRRPMGGVHVVHRAHDCAAVTPSLALYTITRSIGWAVEQCAVSLPLSAVRSE